MFHFYQNDTTVLFKKPFKVSSSRISVSLSFLVTVLISLWTAKVSKKRYRYQSCFFGTGTHIGFPFCCSGFKTGRTKLTWTFVLFFLGIGSVPGCNMEHCQIRIEKFVRCCYEKKSGTTACSVHFYVLIIGTQTELATRTFFLDAKNGTRHQNFFLLVCLFLFFQERLFFFLLIWSRYHSWPFYMDVVISSY